jgi:hypothetical protein
MLQGKTKSVMAEAINEKAGRKISSGPLLIKL